MPDRIPQARAGTIFSYGCQGVSTDAPAELSFSSGEILASNPDTHIVPAFPGPIDRRHNRRAYLFSPLRRLPRRPAEAPCSHGRSARLLIHRAFTLGKAHRAGGGAQAKNHRRSLLPAGASLELCQHMVDVSEPVGVRTARSETRSVPTVPWRVFGPRQAEHIIDFSNWQIAGLFVTLAAITSIPIILYPWPPLADYINHLSRMHIIATIGSDPDLARFYEVNWQIIPNLMMDLVVPWLERVMNVYLAGQIYTVTSFVLIMSGALTLNRRLVGHWSIMPLIAFPLLYNNVFLVGTMNYIFGMGLALWALVAWMWLRERNILLRLVVSAAFVLALFFCHLFAVGLYGLGLLAF